MCPYYLDGDLNSKEFGDYPLTRLLIAQAGLWLLCSFQGSSEKVVAGTASRWTACERTVSQNSTACKARARRDAARSQ